MLIVGPDGSVDVRRETEVPEGAKLGLDFGAVVPGRIRFAPAGGVFVLEVEALPAPFVLNCFVGLLSGDRTPLDPGLAPGVGLAASTLALLSSPP